MARNDVYREYKDLKVYQLAYSLAMELFEDIRRFPLHTTGTLN
jgi:hypothetical protein